MVVDIARSLTGASLVASTDHIYCARHAIARMAYCAHKSLMIPITAYQQTIATSIPTFPLNDEAFLMSQVEGHIDARESGGEADEEEEEEEDGGDPYATGLQPRPSGILSEAISFVSHAFSFTEIVKSFVY